MTQSELNDAINNDKVEVVKTGTTPPDSAPQESVGQPNLLDYLPILSLLRSPQRHLTEAPTFTPKTFQEQIQFVDDGAAKSLYLYFNNAWNSSPLNFLLGLKTTHLSITIPHSTSSDTPGTTGLDFTPICIIGILHNQGSATPQYWGVWTPDFESASMPIGSRADSVTSFLGPDSSIYLHDLSFSGGTLTYHYKNTSVTTSSVAELLIFG